MRQKEAVILHTNSNRTTDQAFGIVSEITGLTFICALYERESYFMIEIWKLI